MEGITYKEEKKSIFNGLLRLIHKIKPEKKQSVDEAQISKFKDFLNEIDKSDTMYEAVEKVADLCDEAVVVAKQRLQIVDRIHKLDEQIGELQCYESLTEEEIEYLKQMLARFLALNEDKNILRFQITGFDKGLVEMEYLEDDAKFSVPFIEYAEKNQRILKRDLGYLQGEKADLEYENEMLHTGQDFVYKLSIIVVGLFGVLATVLAYLSIFRRMSIFYPASFLCILLMVIVCMIYVFKNKITTNLRINQLKQYKAVELINKKNVVYAYYTSFLNFVYKKYNVKNAEKLKKNLKDFGNYKHLTKRFDSIRTNMYETEHDIDYFLREKSIVNNVITTEKFAKTVNIEDKRSYYQDLTKERERLEKKLQDLDGMHESIWNDLVLLNEIDKTPNRIIDRIIQKYLKEVSRLVSMTQHQGEDHEDEIDEIKTVGEIMAAGESIDKMVNLG